MNLKPRRKIAKAFIAGMTALVMSVGITHLSSAEEIKTGSFEKRNWMAYIPSDKLILELSIPGTHDSGAVYDPSGFPDTAKAQDLTIGEQLGIGVRYLDIRCRHINNTFAIHHGAAFMGSYFDDVLKTCTSFLKQNPSETIIMHLNKEYDDAGNTQPFEDTFRKYIEPYKSMFYLDNKIPTLEAARGKIVLIRRFTALVDIDKSRPSLGIGLSGPGYWPDNGKSDINSKEVKETKVYIQDHYKSDGNDTSLMSDSKIFKIKYVKDTLALAKSTQQKDLLFINYTSGYIGVVPQISPVSDVMNSEIINYFSNKITFGRFGIVAMDHINNDLTSAIINTNFEGVTFFMDKSFKGVYTACLPVGNYTLAQLDNYSFKNDMYSSVSVPMGYVVELYKDDNFQGDCRVLTDVINGLDLSKINIDKQVSSVKVKKGVVFYGDKNFKGNSTQGLAKGKYTLKSLQKFGFKKNWASSMAIPTGCTVELYSEDNFKGQCWKLTQMDNNTADFNNFSGNDKVTSVIIK